MSNCNQSPAVAELLQRSLNDPVRQFVSRQGKRIRAGLTELGYRIGGGRGPLPAAIAEAIELLHAGSLVIDDIQDDSGQRRGRPTMHREFGTPLALNAGNFMYFRALEVIGDSTLPAETQYRITQEMIRAGRVCHEGQAVDLAARLDQSSESNYHDIASVITFRKTGALVSLAMTMGSIAAGAERRLIKELGRCGNQVGFALQMRNDLEELASFACGSTDRCDDLRNLRITWPWVWLGEHRDSRLRRDYVKRLQQALHCQDYDSLRSLAGEVVKAVDAIGQDEICRSIDEPVRLLGEHVLEPNVLLSLKTCLHPIRHSSRHRDSLTTVPTGAAT